MHRTYELSPIELQEIRKLAADKRRELGFIGNTPIGCELFPLLKEIGIELVEFPVDSGVERQSFSAVLLYVRVDGSELACIGLNTADYLDNQVFALAHELYHYFEKSEPHLCRLEDLTDSNGIEARANRFAAVFLLPEESVRDIISNEFKTVDLKSIPEQVILRLTARIHCRWWVPYRSIINRFRELEIITAEQYDLLYTQDVRSPDSYYGKVGLATQEETFRKLNSRPRTIGTSPENIDMIIRNYEEALIDEDEFHETMAVFNKSPADFGYERGISQEDLDELAEFFNGDGNES